MIGTIFYLAAIAKTISPTDTENALGWVFGNSMAHTLTIVLILTEIILASILLSGITPRIALGAATLLSAIFLVWILYLYWTQVPVDCGCGVRLPFLTSGGSESHRGVAFVRTAGIFVASGIGLWSTHFQRFEIIRPHTAEKENTHDDHLTI